jgi:hypothetical protein
VFMSENNMADFMERHTIILNGSDRMNVDLPTLGKSTGLALRMKIDGNIVFLAQPKDMIEQFVHAGTIAEELSESIAFFLGLMAFFLFHGIGKTLSIEKSGVPPLGLFELLTHTERSMPTLTPGLP